MSDEFNIEFTEYSTEEMMIFISTQKLLAAREQISKRTPSHETDAQWLELIDKELKARDKTDENFNNA
jgi:hypothetical protein